MNYKMALYRWLYQIILNTVIISISDINFEYLHFFEQHVFYFLIFFENFIEKHAKHKISLFLRMYTYTYNKA
jgi:hypothetical protein